MALIRWNPQSELDSFRRFFDLVHEELRDTSRPWYPPLDLLDENDRLVAQVELPGVDPKQVQIHLQNDLLTVQGEREVTQADGDKKYLRREHAWGAFTRSVQLPYRVQADKVKAQYKNGILSIEMPKAEEHVGRQIQVEIAQ